MITKITESVLNELADRLKRCEVENDQLRAEVERLKECSRIDQQSAKRQAERAEKAEAELAFIKRGHGELGRYEQLRLKNAELVAELAKEKARLDWLLAPCHKRMPDDNRGWKGKPLITRPCYSSNDGSYIGGELITHRNTIDQAMKEESK